MGRKELNQTNKLINVSENKWDAVTHLVLTQIWIFNTVMLELPNFFTMEFYKGIMEKGHSFNSFLKLSLYTLK